ncbi:MAG: mannitol-1-phosphate 5-dehydrogenase [Clostridia bacterium]|nr:mannitol-1-phosphate 5-dehydrogenase [Clostridia bacterium]
MKKAIMYGAGNIGRGFIGELFSKSGYEVVFIDINAALLERLNKERSYPIKVAGSTGYRDIWVKNVRGINAADIDAVAEEIASADIMATAVGVNVLSKIAKPIAMGLKKRWESGSINPLNIIICENLIDANHYLHDLLKTELGMEYHELLENKVGLVEASIGRMVPVVTPEMQAENPLLVCVEEYCELPVDKDAFKGPIPEIVNLRPFSPFSFYIHRKLFMHNMGHATTAYLGFLRNYSYIWEACRDSSIKLIALRALLESSAALSKEHGVPFEELLNHAENLLFRFGNKLLGDTVERVGKDPIRKLSVNDRLVGAAKLCLKHGIKPVYISLGIASGFMFAPESDTAAQEVSKAGRDDLIAALKHYCGLEKDDPISTMVLGFYNILNKEGEAAFEKVIETAEGFKNAG